MTMNDMTDFDKLIKEKVEQASYPYEEAAWKHYKRKAGLHDGSVKYWVVGAASIVTVGAFILFKQGGKVQQTLDQPQQTIVFTEDSVSVSQNSSTGVSEDTMLLQEESKSEIRPRQVPRHNREIVNEHQLRVKEDTPKISKTIYGKPLVIDVDTITRMVPTDEELEKGHSRLY